MRGLISKKLIVGILGAICVLANDLLGKVVSDETIYSMVAILGTYVVAQGVADHGSQGAAKAIEKTVKDILGTSESRSQGPRELNE